MYTYPNGDQQVVLLHLVDMGHTNLVGFERRQRQLSVDEINVALEVGDDQMTSATGACWDVDLLSQVKR